jgi:hypothetical protein
MYRKIIKPRKKEDLQIQLPEKYLNKEMEVIAFERVDEQFQEKRKDGDEAIAFVRSFSVDMSDFKFDRDAANER